MLTFHHYIVFFILFSLPVKATQVRLILPQEVVPQNSPMLMVYKNGKLTNSEVNLSTKGSTVELKGIEDFGIYELVVPGYGRLPLVYHGQQHTIELSPTVEQIKNFGIAVNDTEHKALETFQGYYQRYLGFLNKAENQLRQNWREKGQQIAVQNFIRQFLNIRKGMNLRMDSIQQQHAGSYAAKYLAPLLKTAMPQSTNTDLLKHFHQNYFNHWNLADKAALNNPVVMKELKTYLTFFAISNGEMYNGLDQVFTQQKVWGNVTVTESLLQMVSTELLLLKHPEVEKYIVFMYDNYSQSCSEEMVSAAADNTFNLGTRIRNTMEGSQFPPMVFKSWKEHNRTQKIGRQLKTEKPTLLYFWKSTCEYCKAYAPKVENLAAQYQDKINVVAVSLDDKKENLAGYLQFIENQADRNRPPNWAECWEQNSYNSNQMNQIYLTGTPLYIFLDKDQKILSKTNNIASLANYFENYFPKHNEQLHEYNLVFE